MAIEPRTLREQGFAVEWAKVLGRSLRQAGPFSWRIPAPISAFASDLIPARGTGGTEKRNPLGGNRSRVEGDKDTGAELSHGRARGRAVECPEGWGRDRPGAGPLPGAIS